MLEVISNFNQEVTSVDPDKMEEMCQLIWICSDGTYDKTRIYRVHYQLYWELIFALKHQINSNGLGYCSII